MCWNKEVSLFTFVLGSYFSYNLYTTTKFKTESIIWFFVILMQLFETIIWSDQNCGILNYIGTKGAMLANILQPIVVLITALYFNKYPPHVIALTTSVTLMYLFMVFKKHKELKEIKCVKPSCKHLKYTWWDVVDPKYYLVTLFILMMMLWKNPYSNIFYVFVTLYLASAIFKDNNGSVWCWMAAFGPLWTKYVKF